MINFNFKKDKDSKWYLYLQDWDGDKDDLEIVLGGEVFLDTIAKDKDSIRLSVFSDEIEEYKHKLSYIKHASGNGEYHLETNLYDYPVWISHIIEKVLGNKPKTLYINY